jgi:hypothetical protein
MRAMKAWASTDDAPEEVHRARIHGVVNAPRRQHVGGKLVPAHANNELQRAGSLQRRCRYVMPPMNPSTMPAHG